MKKRRRYPSPGALAPLWAPLRGEAETVKGGTPFHQAFTGGFVPTKRLGQLA
jgi:hypothetical protein